MIKPTLVFSFDFAVRPQRVFDVLTQPEHLNRWFTTGAEVDLQVGGHLTNGDGERGKFIKVAVPRQLVFTYTNDQIETETEVDMTFQTSGPLNRTMLRIVQKGIDPKQTSEATYAWLTQRWNYLGVSLKRYLDKQGRLTFERFRARRSPVFADRS
jgi:uncharacterized protein YndB with AHSA1/START domain